MSTADKHLRTAAENQAFLSHICERLSEYPAWCVTAAFYVSVHYVEAAFALDDFHSKDHFERGQTLRRERRYEQMRLFHSKLQNASMVARYESGSRLDFLEVFPLDYIQNTIIGHWLHQVRKSHENLMKGHSKSKKKSKKSKRR